MPLGRTAFILRLCASLLFGACATGSMAQQPAPISPTPPQPSEEKVHAAADQLAWHQRMAARPKPMAGCFTATFPSEEWKEAQCAILPKMPHKRPPPLARLLRTTPATKVPARPSGLAVAGSGNDLAATAVGGPITAAEGFFDQTVDIQTVTSVASATQTAPGAYALQINVAPFATPAACAHA